MSQEDITPAEALTRLADATASAIAKALEAAAPGVAQRGQLTLVPEGGSPFTGLEPGAVATSVSYVDGVTGGNIFVLSQAGARALAIAMGAASEEEGEGGELSELQLSAVAEAGNQLMAAAAGAIGVILGQEVEISPPNTRVIAELQKDAARWGSAPHAIYTTFLVGGEPCRLIQLVPSAFVVRMVRAIDEREGEELSRQLQAGAGEARGSESDGLREAIGDVNVRVWAELGRTRLPLGRALSLPLGAVVDLDCGADAPVDIYVNGLLYGQGQLFVTDDGEWAVELQDVAMQYQRKGALV